MGGTTTGGVRIILRLEGLGVLILALLANSKWGIDWRNFALFFFAPDLSMLGYFAGPRIGAVLYNLGHSCLGGMVCVALGVLLPAPILFDASPSTVPASALRPADRIYLSF
jgi:ABC-type phosphate/phosphonate transport system permease subunit